VALFSVLFVLSTSYLVAASIDGGVCGFAGSTAAGATAAYVTLLFITAAAAFCWVPAAGASCSSYTPLNLASAACSWFLNSLTRASAAPYCLVRPCTLAAAAALAASSAFNLSL